MEKKIVKIMKITAVVCVVILLIEFIYIGFFMKEKSVYFDGINAVVEVDEGLLTVGSNNNNEQYFEKAKITRYNEKKEKIFEKIYNKGYNGVFLNVIEDSYGNYVAVGSYEATKEELENSIRTALIVKYDKDGNILYEADFQLLGNSKYTSIVEVEDGYIVAGQSIYENMVVGVSEDGGAFLVKYNKELEVEWMKSYGNSKTAVFNDIILHKNYIYAVGMDDLGIGVIAKYDLKGELKKSVKFEDIDNLGFSGIVYSNNNLFVCSGIIDDDSDDMNADGVILQYSLDLELEKKEIYEADSSVRFNQLVVDEIDNVIAIGTSAIIDDMDSDDEVNVFNHDGVIAKYDKNLEKVMVVSYGDDRDDYLTDIIVYDDSYLITGYSSYEDGSYLSKFITYSYALKTLGVE